MSRATNQPIKYNPEIAEFMKLNGFSQSPEDLFPGGQMFIIQDKLAVQMWGQKIQAHRWNGWTWISTGSYAGFDGQDIGRFMMIMHVMDVIDLNTVKKMSDDEIRRNTELSQRPAINYNSRANLICSNY